MARPSLVSTENQMLDELLKGGLPQRAVVVIEGWMGRLSLLVPLLARTTERHLAAIIDNGELYPPALAQAGVRLEHLLVVPARTPLLVARAVDTLLRSRCCAMIVMPAVTLHGNVWMRLAHLVQRGNALVVVLATPHTARAIPATVRLQCGATHFAIQGARGPWRFCTGYTTDVSLVKHRFVSARTQGIRAS